MKAPRTSSPLLPFAMLVLTLVLAALDQTILSTAVPVISRELPGGWPLAWVFSAYLLAATVVIALYGRLADVLGKKPMLLLAIGLFLAGSLACGASQNVQQLVLARALQGAGGGGLMTLAMLTVPDLFAPEQRGRYQALLGAAYGVSTMFGPLMGGALVEHLSWHWAFWMNVPPAALAWGVLASTLPSKPGTPTAAQAPATQGRQRMAIDWLGAALLTAALVLLLLATQHGQLHLPEQVSLWLLLALGATFTLGFLWRQKRAAHPLLPLSLFARPAYAAVSLIGTATGVALYAAVVFLPQYLQIGLHLSPTGSAWHLLPLMAGITLAAITSGKLLRAQRPAASIARAACLLMLLSFGLMAGVLQWLPARPLALSAALLPLGLGLGLLFPIVTVVAQRVSPAQHMGIATAAPIMLRSLGGAAGVALLAALLVHLMKRELATTLAHVAPAGAVTAALAHGLQSVFGCAAAAVLLALVATNWLMKKQPREGLAKAGALEATS
ncbi:MULTISPECIES: MFS transporter [Variovorax]|uniref:MFS transporter n=1 Tax=Variovorax TaxID=34072 RepID=UPI0028562E1C|nr:MFS transporter [Variovorax sp. 3319]MDR6889154.1 EmrB/QacA subfamily drug resistance transporter [Variovorax sp. 3319]